ncbi:MAG TPA: transporter, partial [Acidiphilium sp.]
MKSKISLKAFKFASVCGLVALGAAGVTGLATSPARAAAPLPFDLPTPPPNVNIGILYNQFSSAGSFYTANGAKVGNTSISTYVPIFRYTHTFGHIDGMQWGVQLIVPDVNFLGTPKVGGADLSNNSGLAEPALSAFIYPYDNPSEDSYLVLAYFLSPPVGAYQSTKAL